MIKNDYSNNLAKLIEMLKESNFDKRLNMTIYRADDFTKAADCNTIGCILGHSTNLIRPEELEELSDKTNKTEEMFGKDTRMGVFYDILSEVYFIPLDKRTSGWIDPWTFIFGPDWENSSLLAIKRIETYLSCNTEMEEVVKLEKDDYSYNYHKGISTIDFFNKNKKDKRDENIKEPKR